MPLTATFDPGHNHYPNENVYFFMNDRDRRVRCGVSELALEVFDPQFERSKEGRLLAFNKYRPHIESVASAKYDRGQMERDGRSVLVSAADIQATFRPSLLGPQSLESTGTGREARGGEGGTHHTPPSRRTGMRAWLKPEQHGRALVARLKTPA
jgi:uncharacterized protein DUF1488